MLLQLFLIHPDTIEEKIIESGTRYVVTKYMFSNKNPPIFSDDVLYDFKNIV